MLYPGFSDKKLYTRLKVLQLIIDEGYKNTRKLKTQLLKFYPELDSDSFDIDSVLSKFLCTAECGYQDTNKLTTYKEEETKNYMENLRYDNILKSEILKDFSSDVKVRHCVVKYLENANNSSKQEKIMSEIESYLDDWMNDYLCLKQVNDSVKIYTINSTVSIKGEDVTKVYLTHSPITDSYLKSIKEYILQNLFDIPGITMPMKVRNQYLQICSNITGNIYLAFAVLAIILSNPGSEEDKNTASIYYTALLDMLKTATEHKKSMREYYKYDLEFGTPVITSKFIALGNRDDTISIISVENPESSEDAASNYSTMITIDKNDYEKFLSLRRLRTSEQGVLMTGTFTVWSKLFGDSLKPKDYNYNNCQSSNAI